MGHREKISTSEGCVVIFMTTLYSDLLKPMIRLFQCDYELRTIVVHVGQSKISSAKLSEIGEIEFKTLDVEPYIIPCDKGEVPSCNELVSEGLAIERELGIRPLELFRGDRHFAHGFVVGASYSRSRYGEKMSLEQGLDWCKRGQGTEQAGRCSFGEAEAGVGNPTTATSCTKWVS